MENLWTTAHSKVRVCGRTGPNVMRPFPMFRVDGREPESDVVWIAAFPFRRHLAVVTAAGRIRKMGNDSSFLIGTYDMDYITCAVQWALKPPPPTSSVPPGRLSLRNPCPHDVASDEPAVSSPASSPLIYFHPRPSPDMIHAPYCSP